MKEQRSTSIYEEIRTNELKLSREKASELLECISPDMLEKMEKGKTTINPSDVVLFAEKYKHPELCNHYCKNECEIGKSQVLAISIPELPQIILSTINALNDLNQCLPDLIKVSHDGQISDNEISDFAKSEVALSQLVLAANTLKLWIEKSKQNNEINSNSLEVEIRKLLNS